MKKGILTLLLLIAAQVGHAEELDLTKYKGQVIYLDFWASWCAPCKESFPWLNEMTAKHPGLKIIGINLDKNRADGESFLKKYPAQFEIVFNSSGSLAEKYKVKGMPYSVLIDKDGKEVFSHIGFSAEKAKTYTSEITKLLGDKK